MLTGIHFLLTYACNYECDHCFLYCGPGASGTFTLDQVRRVLDDAGTIGSVSEVFFEGGEPFLYYPLMLESIRLAKTRGLRTGVVTNCYWSTAVEDAEIWLGPLRGAGLDGMSVSDDEFHQSGDGESPAQRAARAAQAVGLSAGSICIEAPAVTRPTDGKGEPVLGGGALFKGRAADKLTTGLPTRPAGEFIACKHEELAQPRRVHVDAFGHVQVCQGVSIGNLWETPLSELLREYDATAHPICGPLIRGGPSELASEHGIELEGGFVDECHYCFELRRALLERFPDALAPRQVYGKDSPE